MATIAEAMAGMDTTRALTADSLGSSNLASANGYYKLPGGFVAQWGYSAGSGTGDRVITLPEAVTTLYSVVLGQRTTASSGSSRPIVVRSLATTTFTVYIAGDVNSSFRNFYWFAIGKD